jgi:actin cytoskeleton-regulatory complex protein PAN1
MVPPSARDLNSSVDIVKEILKNDTRSASYKAPVSKMRERSFNSNGTPGAGGRQDATVYKHDETTPPPGGVYQPRSRHVDRSTVRVNSDDPADDLSVMKKQLENTARMLDRTTEENALRTREDEELERETDDLRYRIKRLQDDLDYVSRGPRSVSKDEERRKLERELLHLMHEKLPSLEKRIEENQVRKDREKRDQLRDRDLRNERFGRFSDRDDDRDRYRYGDEDGRYSRNSYDRDVSRDHSRNDRDRDYNHRDYDRYDKRDERGRGYDSGRPRSPPAARSPPPPPPPAASTTTLNVPPAPPTRAVSTPPSQSKMSQEEYKAFIKAEAQRKIQEKMRAYGLHTASTPTPEFSDVADRLAQEKKEAEEKARAAEKAAEERVRLREERLANEKALKEGVTTSRPAPPKPRAAAPVPTPPKPTPPAPPKPRIRPQPPPRKVSAPHPPAPPAPVTHTPPQAPVSPPELQDDSEEERIKAREAELQKKREARVAREARAARLRELEAKEEEEARLAEAEFEKRKQVLAKSSSTMPMPPTPPSVVISPPVPSQPQRELVAPTPPPVPSASPGDKSSTNPFSRLLGDGSAATQSPAPPSVPAANGGTNPFFKNQAASPLGVSPPPKSSTPVPVKTIYHTAPTVSDDEWDEVVEKEEGDSSEDEFTGSRDKRKNLAEKFFGNILPPIRSQSAGPVVNSSQPSPPMHTSPPSPPPPPPSAPPAPVFGIPDAPPPPPPSGLPPASAPSPTISGDHGALFSAIQGGAKLRKAVTNDRSGSALSGKVLGDTAPPSHITSALHSSSPSIDSAFDSSTSDLLRSSEYDSRSLSHRQSVDWYAGLAADHGAPRDRELSVPTTLEEAEGESEAASVPAPNIQIETIVDNNDPLEDVDRSVGTLRF